MQRCNLIVDTGNTQTKIAVIGESGEVLMEQVAAMPKLAAFDAVVERYAPSKAIVASTRGDAEHTAAILRGRVPYVLCMNSRTAVPIEVEYDRSMIGVDRLATAVGAVEEYGRDCAMLIVDMGSAITFDYVENGAFCGGNISAGVAMRFKALHDNTAALPMCDGSDFRASEEGEVTLGRTTVEALKAGVMQSVFYEVEGYANDFLKKNRDIRIIFTGGDAEYFVNRIKNAIFAGRKIMYCGLNRILEYNAANEKI
jgi:type III pantothenate kinase